VNYIIECDEKECDSCTPEMGAEHWITVTVARGAGHSQYDTYTLHYCPMCWTGKFVRNIATVEMLSTKENDNAGG